MCSMNSMKQHQIDIYRTETHYLIENNRKMSTILAQLI